MVSCSVESGANRPLLAFFSRSVHDARSASVRNSGVRSSTVICWRANGAGFGRERLRRPGLLARHGALLDRPLLDRPQRLAGDAIEHEQEAVLGGQRHGVDRLAVVLDGDQLRRRGEVVVPQVVVHDLEVPHALAGARVERDQRVRVEVAADAIGAVVVVGRRAGREVGDAAARVDRDLAPGVGAADVLPGVLRPRLVALLAGMRHRVERPHQLAGDDVVGAQRARRRQVAFAGRRAEQQQVLEDLARRARLHAADQRGVAADALAQVDEAVRAERQDRLAGGGVDGLEVVVDLEDQPAIAAVRALPVVDAAPGDAAQPGVDPQLLAGGRVERDERLVLRQHVHRGADDDRIELVDVVVADRVGPRHLQAGDVLRRDLREVDELRGVGAAAVVLPLRRRLAAAPARARAGAPASAPAACRRRRRRCTRRARRDGRASDARRARWRTERGQATSWAAVSRRPRRAPLDPGGIVRPPGPSVCVSCNGLCAAIVCSARERVKRDVCARARA